MESEISTKMDDEPEIIFDAVRGNQTRLLYGDPARSKTLTELELHWYNKRTPPDTTFATYEDNIVRAGWIDAGEGDQTTSALLPALQAPSKLPTTSVSLRLLYHLFYIQLLLQSRSNG